ncbi:MAG: DUF3801 domain-containing protein [Oscillospiraceae bacterium]|nr:DUF3801 domain-containing protein [Oscillospiraceae bacterium]
MNTSGEVADLMVKEGLQITEEVAKLAGLGAKNLAAIIIALLKEDNKLQGKTNLKKLLKSDKPLCILQIKEKDIGKFNNEAKRYGVLFTAVKDNTNNTGLCDIIAKQEDVTKLNYIMEKMGYAAPEPEIEPERDDEAKKRSPRAKENQQENESLKRGDTEKTGRGTENRKPSVRDKVENIKREQTKKDKLPEKQKSKSKKKAKSKKKTKGKTR